MGKSAKKRRGKRQPESDDEEDESKSKFVPKTSDLPKNTLVMDDSGMTS